MGSSSSNLGDKHVVIVGGGYAGTALANLLKGKCKVTLIDPKDCFHHTIASLRATVEKGYAKKIFIPYEPTYGDSFKRGMVTSIDRTSKKVILEGGEEISYDYLVLATGSSGAFPSKLDLSEKDASLSQAIDLYNSTQEKISAAKDIVIIGGGPVGIELAGEIITDMKDKKVTLIHSKSALINNGNFSEKLRKNVLDQLQAKGVEVLLEHKVTNLDELPKDGMERCKVQTDRGAAVDADLVFVCIGMKTNSSAYSKAFSGNLDEIGCLKVDEFLRVDGSEDVFAIGDCCTADEQGKMAFKAACHAEVVAKNIQLHAQGKCNLKRYDLAFNAIFVPIGRNGGVSQFGSMVFGNFLTKVVKSNGLFTSKSWDDMKQKMPTS